MRLNTAIKLGMLMLAVAALVALGFWQIQRGREKQRLIADFRQAEAAEAVPLTATLPLPQGLLMQPVSFGGHYEPAHQLLLDNQQHGERSGYDVWTPFRLDSGALIVVDRGWIADAKALSPPPAGEQQLRGLRRTLPQPGLRLGASELCSGQGWPRAVLYPQPADLRCLLGEAPLPGVVLLDPHADGGYVRDWLPVQGFPPQRHFGYAMQWFALAATLLVLTLLFMFRSRR